ncbi:tudor domain-containing protein 5 isoform X2 [Osmerus eperlanus]|uniref:tudor domain-containing protein 5 isoform X2 n=1 Tax=Osmerus eperlanus TaxID=29151 RepID=UPI002E0EC873
MTQEQMLAELKKDVRSLLMSAKMGLAPDQLKRDYANMVGHPLPLRSFGFRNVLDMVREMPDVVALDYLADGSLVLKAISDDSTRGIEELVARQRVAKGKTSNRRGGMAFFSPRYLHRAGPITPMVLPRRGWAPPALPAQLRTQLRVLLSQGPISLSALEVSFARCFGQPLRVTNYGFYSVAEMLGAAADMVAVQQGRSGSVLSLKGQPPVTSRVRTQPARTPSLKPPKPALTIEAVVSPAVNSQAPVESPRPPSTQNHVACLSKAPLSRSPCPGATERGQHSPGATERGQHMEPTAPEPQPSSEDQLFQKCIIKLEQEMQQCILENGHAGTVSSELKTRLRQVVSQNSEGISVHDLPSEYKRAFGEELPVIQSGFLSVTEMAGALNDTLHLRPVKEGEGVRWMVADIKHVSQSQPEPSGPGGDESGEGLNPSRAGYYLSSKESPWEGPQSDPVAEDDDPPGCDEALGITNKTYHQMADPYPTMRVITGGEALVPPDALRGQRLRAPTRRSPRALVPVLVEWVESPSHFYLRFDENQETRALENMMMEMRSCYTCPKVSERYHLPPRYVRRGQACCVAPRDMWFYRVVIHRVLSDTQVEVYYVDFGDLTSVDRASLKFLKSCYSELPAQAVPSCLVGVKPIRAEWSAEATGSFQKLCCERTLVAALHSYQRDVLQLFLCDTHTEEDVYAHSALQDQGHGLHCSSAASAAHCGQLNPVTLYLGEGVFDEGMEIEDEPGPAEPSLDSPTTLQPSPSPSPPLKAPYPDLDDLPELEVFKELNSQVQDHKLDQFEVLRREEPVLCCSVWDQAWTPDPDPREPKTEPSYHRDAAELSPALVAPPQPSSLPAPQPSSLPAPQPSSLPAPQPSSIRTLSLHTPELMESQSCYYGLPFTPVRSPTKFIFPLFGRLG